MPPVRAERQGTRPDDGAHRQGAVKVRKSAPPRDGSQRKSLPKLRRQSQRGQIAWPANHLAAVSGACSAVEKWTKPSARSIAAPRRRRPPGPAHSSVATIYRQPSSTTAAKPRTCHCRTQSAHQRTTPPFFRLPGGPTVSLWSIRCEAKLLTQDRVGLRHRSTCAPHAAPWCGRGRERRPICSSERRLGCSARNIATWRGLTTAACGARRVCRARDVVVARDQLLDTSIFTRQFVRATVADAVRLSRRQRGTCRRIVRPRRYRAFQIAAFQRMARATSATRSAKNVEIGASARAATTRASKIFSRKGSSSAPTSTQRPTLRRERMRSSSDSRSFGGRSAATITSRPASSNALSAWPNSAWMFFPCRNCASSKMRRSIPRSRSLKAIAVETGARRRSRT